MYSVLTIYDVGFRPIFQDDVSDNNTDPLPDDVWLFTDPVAKVMYSQKEKLNELEWDIRNYVMYKGRWSPDELQFRRELRRLVNACILTPKNSFGHLSPHPTIYSAVKDGAMVIGGVVYNFNAGDEIVFEPWLERLSHPGLVGPLRIGRLDTINKCFLSCDAFPQFEKSGENDFAILHQILYCPRYGSLRPG